jgi:hypothetical protein
LSAFESKLSTPPRKIKKPTLRAGFWYSFVDPERFELVSLLNDLQALKGVIINVMKHW